jgi:long-chain acyl-CoA synthetase
MTTFRDPVARAARCYGARTALVDAPTGAVSSFRAVADAVARMPALLDEIGVDVGGRVAILADGSAAYATLYLAIPAAGRVVVPLNTRYTESELGAACDDGSPLLLVTDRPPDQTAGLAPKVLGVDEVMAALGRADPAGSADGRAGAPQDDDAAAIFYTGGTTDRAKGVVQSHRNKLVDALSLVAGIGLDEHDRWLVMSPMFHAAGSFNVLPCLWVGATQVFLPRFDAVAALQAIQEHRITVTFGVPTMLRALVAAQRVVQADLSSLRLLGHGGAPMAEADAMEVAATFPAVELCAMYGATEMAPLATIHRHQEAVLGTARGRSAGRAVLGVDVTVRRPDGSEAAAGELGEIVVRGPNVMVGYWRKPDATAAVVRDGAYWSGDIGYQDDEGHVFVVDRSKDMIITGGENVYGVEVEGVLAAHPAVAEAAVIGTPDPHWGEIVVAVVVTCAEVAEDELAAHCRAQLAGYKVPRRYEFRTDPLPRSAAGKLLKRELRG